MCKCHKKMLKKKNNKTFANGFLDKILFYLILYKTHQVRIIIAIYFCFGVKTYVISSLFYSQKTHSFKLINELSTFARLKVPINRHVSSSRIDIPKHYIIYRYIISVIESDKTFKSFVIGENGIS